MAGAGKKLFNGKKHPLLNVPNTMHKIVRNEVFN
jgi:hypothetical protein